jgi:hypothetical protein
MLDHEKLDFLLRVRCLIEAKSLLVRLVSMLSKMCR